MAFGDQIYRQTKITTDKCHECETRFIKMLSDCHAINAQNAAIKPLCSHRKVALFQSRDLAGILIIPLKKSIKSSV